MSDRERSPCARCKGEPREPGRGKRYCLLCELELAEGRSVDADEALRLCRTCEVEQELDNFRIFNLIDNRARYRKTCFRCAFDEAAETLSPYQHAIVDVERQSGIPSSVWLNKTFSVWNRLHYERMCELAHITRPSDHLPTRQLYSVANVPGGELCENFAGFSARSAARLPSSTLRRGPSLPSPVQPTSSTGCTSPAKSAA